MLFWLISLYPIKQTCETLKKISEEPKKVNDNIAHWCTYWLIYSFFMQYDFILSFIPFWFFFSPFILVLSYNPIYTKMIYDGAVQTLRYKILLLNKSLNFQAHMDLAASKYLIPSLDFMEQNVASKLPSPLSDILVNFSKTIHAIFITENTTQRGYPNQIGPYKISDPTMKTD